VPILIGGAGIPGEQGSGVAFVIGIGDRKAAVAQLRMGGANLGSHLESIGDGVIAPVTDGRITRMNAAAERLTGWASTEALHGPLPDVFRVVDARTQAPLADPALLAMDRVHSITLANHAKLLSRDGTEHHISYCASPIRQPNGQIAGAVLVFSDISAEYQVRAELTRTAELLERTGEMAMVGGWELDLRTQDLHWSLETCRIHEVDPLVAPPLADAINFYVPEARPVILAAVQAGIDSGKPWDLELPLITAKGRNIWVRAQGFAVREHGTIVKLHGAFQDVTLRRRATEETAALEAQLNHAMKMQSVGRLAGGVAHDFNNMLSVIVGHTEIALSQIDPSASVHADLLEIKKASERSGDLTRQLLAFARKQTVSPRALNLNASIDALLTMRPKLIGEDIQFVWRPEPSLWLAKLDPTQVDQLFTNLCVNARDAISGVGRIEVATANCTIDDNYCATHDDASPGDYVRLTVRDTGGGMSADVMAHLFEPFFTTKGLGLGTGLGLATVYGSVRQNDGFITVDSEPGLGTEFGLYFRRFHGEVEPASRVEEPEAIHGGRETILVVEDEPAILRLVSRALEAHGYTVLATTSSVHALRLAADHALPIDLLLTDVVMPELNGRDLANRLRARQPSLKCLFMSGYTADVIDKHGVIDNSAQFIGKPFSIAALVSKMQEVIARETPGEQR